MIKQGDPKKRGKASRNKGKSGELELMHILNETWGLNVRRGHVFDHESDLVGLTGVHPEVKRQKNTLTYTRPLIRRTQRPKNGKMVCRRYSTDVTAANGL